MSQSSVIGAGTVVRGNLEGEGSLDIFGRVEGDVAMSGDVTVAEGASVRGNITATRVSVQGAVQGDLRGTEAVLLERGAKVVGDLSAPRIGIGTGALVRGSVRTEGEPVPTAHKRAAALSPALKPPALAIAAKPVAKVEPKAAPLPVREPEPIAVAAAALPRPKEREPERRPPPPVLPSLGKGVKATKKKGRD
jgi:cytoskeletal protein CcmA (bactofilin family)